MEMDPEAIRRRVAKRISELGLEMKALSIAIGRNAAYIQQYVERGIPRKLKEDDRRLLAPMLELDEQELGGPAPSDPTPAKLTTVEEIDVKGGAGAGYGIHFSEQSRSENGIVVSTDAVRDLWGLPETFLRGELRVSRTAAKIIEIYGDSMYDPANPGAPGSLFPGDRVIIDTADLRPSPPGAFALWDGTGIVVKMVEVVPRTEPAMIRLISRNPAYRPYEASIDEVRIIGRLRVRISQL